VCRQLESAFALKKSLTVPTAAVNIGIKMMSIDLHVFHRASADRITAPDLGSPESLDSHA